MRVQFTARDQKVLQSLANFGFLSTAQINRIAFSNVDYRTVLRRLRKLEAVKLLLSNQIYKGGTNIWFLSKKGASIIGEIQQFKSINKNTIAHDLLSNDIRIKLESLGLFSKWKSSHMMKQKLASNESPFGKEIDNISDWFCIAQGQRKKLLAIEVEQTYKGIKRMRSIFKKYQRHQAIDHLWYVVPTLTFGKKVMRIANEYNQKKNWFICSLTNDLLKNPTEAKLYTNTGILKLSDLFYRPAHSSAHSVITQPAATIHSN